MTWRAKITMLGYTCFLVVMVLAAGVKLASSNIPDCQPDRSSYSTSTVAPANPATCGPVDVDLDINEPELFDDMPWGT